MIPTRASCATMRAMSSSFVAVVACFTADLLLHAPRLVKHGPDSARCASVHDDRIACDDAHVLLGVLAREQRFIADGDLADRAVLVEPNDRDRVARELARPSRH